MLVNQTLTSRVSILLHFISGFRVGFRLNFHSAENNNQQLWKRRREDSFVQTIVSTLEIARN